MREMPSVIHDPITAEGIDVPALSRDKWYEAVVALVGRHLTDEEMARVAKCAKNNWTVVVTAEDILGRQLTPEEVVARRKW